MAALFSFPGVRDLADKEGRTALMWAAQRGNSAVLKVMLEREVELQAADKQGATGTHTPLPWLSRCQPLPSSLPPALHAASLAGHAACSQLLLQHGADMDAVDQNGHTPLFRACERGHTEAVVVLLNAGAAVGLLDAGGRSCLHWAASGGLSVICSSLLRQGLPVDSGDHGG